MHGRAKEACELPRARVWLPHAELTDERFRERFGRNRPTRREYQLAALVKVRADRRLRQRTPEWIIQLAREYERANPAQRVGFWQRMLPWRR